MEAPLAIQEYIEYVIINLIDHPESASVLHSEKEGRHEYRIRLHPDDTGRIIGRNGKTITAIRSLAYAAAIKNDLKIDIELDE